MWDGFHIMALGTCSSIGLYVWVCFDFLNIVFFLRIIFILVFELEII